MPLLKLWVFMLTMLLQALLAAGLRCHSCVLSKDHKLCNSQPVEECEGEGQTCFTQRQRFGTFNKAYTKGCMPSDRCLALEGLNSDHYCDHMTSKCTYCCRLSTDLCNAQGCSSATQGQSVVALLVISLCVVKWMDL